MTTLKDMPKTAEEAYATRKTWIDELLKQIKAGLNKRDKAAAPNWADVADQGAVLDSLWELRDRLNG